MNIGIIYDFLKKLVVNNNREWFNNHRSEFEKAKAEHEELVNYLINQISLFDENIKGVESKDCVFRIYRDTRFSPDKTPYKDHVGAYIASGGGRKSERAGYYVHISPVESFVSGGIYSPQPHVLKALREAVYHNIDEYLGIVNQKEFKKYFTEFFSEPLKTVPRGFPKDFEHADLLKCRHYAPASPVENDFWETPGCEKEIVKRFKILYPFNRFMNFTVDECFSER
jgi:uncharacterized protein (TIGR02453 family)